MSAWLLMKPPQPRISSEATTLRMRTNLINNSRLNVRFIYDTTIFQENFLEMINEELKF